MSDVFEGEEVTLSCTFETGEPKTNEVTFEVLRGGEVAMSEKVPLKDKSALYQPTAPAVKDTEANWELSYQVKVDAHPPIAGKETYRVWPREVKLKAIAKDGGKPVEGVVLVATQGEDSRVGRSAKTTGEATIALAKAASFTVEVEPPWRLESVVEKESKKRDLEVKVFRGIKAEFVDFAGVVGADPISQFVNVPATGAKGADGCGNRLSLKVGAKGDQTNDVKQGMAGDKIYFTVKFGRESKRNDPVPAVLNSADAKSLTNEDGGKTHKGHVELDSDGGTKIFEIELGYAGGDTCEVKIGGTDACGDATLKFVNWRKVLYRLGYADVLAPDLGTGAPVDLPDDLQAVVQTALKTIFVEWELLESVSYDLEELAKTEKLAKVSGDFLTLGGRARSILNADILKKLDAKLKTLPPQSHALQLNLCDKILKRPTKKDTLKSGVTTATVDFKVHYAHYDSVSKATWVANIPDTSVYKKPLTANCVVDDTGATGGHVVVRDAVTGKEVDLDFTRALRSADEHLSVKNKGKLDRFIDELVQNGRGKRLRDDQEIQLKLIAETGNPRRTTRNKETEDYLKAKLGAITVYTHPGLQDDGKLKTGDIDVADCEVKSVSKITVTLPEPVGAASENTCPLDVTLSYREYDGGNGSMGGGKGMFCLRPGDLKGFAKTIVHEVGHAMGLAPLGTRVPSPGLTSKDVDHGGFYYCNKIGSTPVGQGYRDKHNGHHCAAGCADVSDIKLAGQKGTCIMFGGPIDDQHLDPPKFCPDCLDHAKARKLADLRTEWNRPTRAADEF